MTSQTINIKNKIDLTINEFLIINPLMINYLNSIIEECDNVVKKSIDIRKIKDDAKTKSVSHRNIKVKRSFAKRCIETITKEYGTNFDILMNINVESIEQTIAQLQKHQLNAVSMYNNVIVNRQKTMLYNVIMLDDIILNVQDFLTIINNYKNDVENGVYEHDELCFVQEEIDAMHVEHYFAKDAPDYIILSDLDQMLD